MNVIALDHHAIGKKAQASGSERPSVFRRVVRLPGASRMRRPGLEPTRLLSGKPHKPIEIIDAPVGHRWPALAVLAAFSGFLLRMLWRKIRLRSSSIETGRDLRAVFERLGGMWMKVGQLMSLRRDVLPEEICDELAQLQHRAQGFPPDIAIAVIERALGRPIDEVFSSFDPQPFAAASLSQVHAARLRGSGDDVVVKVLRPGVREKFARDMRILRFIAMRLNSSPRLRQFRLRDALGEFEQIFLEETDYRYEISNMREMRRTTRGHGIYIPKVYQRISTENVIVMEYVSGVLMSDLIRIRNEDPDRVDRWLAANNVSTRRVGKRLLISFMRQLFETNLFHADLHPGNIILLRDSRVALIDMGSIGTLDREFLTLYRGIQRALAEKDYGKAADLQLRLCAQLPSRDLPELRRDLARCLRVWSGRTRVKHLPFHERSVNAGSAEVSRILYRYGAQQTWEFLRIARTLSTLDASLQYLYRDLDYISILNNYFKTAAQRAVGQALRPTNLARAFGSVAATIDEYHLMMGPVMRASAFSFEATISKASRVFALVVRMALGVAALVAAGLVYRYSMQHLPRVHGELRIDPIDRMVRILPDMDVAWWAVVIVGALITVLALRVLLRELLRPDPRSARKSQG
ncbi:MAG: ABC1 kinase family protein [Acetobacteraceae bacterium]